MPRKMQLPEDAIAPACPKCGSSDTKAIQALPVIRWQCQSCGRTTLDKRHRKRSGQTLSGMERQRRMIAKMEAEGTLEEWKQRKLQQQRDRRAKYRKKHDQWRKEQNAGLND